MTWLRVKHSLLSIAPLLVAAIVARAQATPPLPPPPPPATQGAIVGHVTVKDGASPLAYSVVSIESLGRERFADAQGEFRFVDLPTGLLRIRVRHVGYVPVDVPVTVRGGIVDTVNVALTHIAVRLSTVQVRGYPECKNPGAPAAADDSAFATVFDQLRQNADQYRLLTSEYPFTFAIERMMATATYDGQIRMERVDTMSLASINQWKYKPGAVVTSEGRLFHRSFILNLPTLVSFADTIFIANHCFYNGGLETVDGKELLRVDFIAASRIRDPDVDGAMYLDPASFQIRRSLLHLSKIPRGVNGLAEVDVTTLFGEIFPSVPVIAAVSSVNQFTTDRPKFDTPVRGLEEQRLIAVNFLKSRPGDSPKKPKQ
jgi:carboxypeptidase family protein